MYRGLIPNRPETEKFLVPHFLLCYSQVDFLYFIFNKVNKKIIGIHNTKLNI